MQPQLSVGFINVWLNPSIPVIVFLCRYIGHLPVGTTVESVRDLCTPFGAVGDIRIKVRRGHKDVERPSEYHD